MCNLPGLGIEERVFRALAGGFLSTFHHQGSPASLEAAGVS